MAEQLPLFDSTTPREPLPGAPCCYTLGYRILRDNTQLVTVAEALDATVVDIRYMPFTKAPLWNKRQLKAALGSRYVWIEALGNRAYRSPQHEIVIDDWPLGLQKLEKVLARGPVILLCVCATPDGCHRRVVATQVQIVFGVPIRHLDRARVDALTKGGEPRA